MSATSNAEMVVRIGRIARVEAKLVFMIAAIEYSLLVGGRFLAFGFWCCCMGFNILQDMLAEVEDEVFISTVL